MLSIEYDKGKMSSLVKGLSNFAQTAQNQIKIVVTASVLDIQTGAAINAPYKRGILRKGISHDVEISGLSVVGIVGSNVPYSRIQEKGGNTGRNHATYIRPKRYLGRAIDSNKAKISERFRKMKLIQG